MRGDPDRAVVLSRHALAVCPHIDAAVHSGLMTFLALGCLIQNDLPGCARAYAEAVDLARSSGSIMLEVVSRASLGTLNECMGRLHEAKTIFQEAPQTATLRLGFHHLTGAGRSPRSRPVCSLACFAKSPARCLRRDSPMACRMPSANHLSRYSAGSKITAFALRVPQSEGPTGHVGDMKGRQTGRSYWLAV
jgi:hypothetical protein